MPKILPDDDNAEGTNSLNSKQREVFNVVHIWDKDCLEYNGHNLEPVQIFLSGSRGTGKFYLVKVIYNATSKLCFILLKILKNLEFLCLDL